MFTLLVVEYLNNCFGFKNKLENKVDYLNCRVPSECQSNSKY